MKKSVKREDNTSTPLLKHERCHIRKPFKSLKQVACSCRLEPYSSRCCVDGVIGRDLRYGLDDDTGDISSNGIISRHPMLSVRTGHPNG
jgi:hypothetical protein